MDLDPDDIFRDDEDDPDTELFKVRPKILLLFAPILSCFQIDFLT